MNSGRESCCTWCLLFLFAFAAILFITTFILPLSSDPNAIPRFYINEFYVPTLNISSNYSRSPFSNTTTNHNFNFDVKLQNSNIYRGVRYNSVNLTFFYIPQCHASDCNGFATPPPIRIAKYTIPGFYQGRRKAVVRTDLVAVAPRLPPWYEEAARAVSGGYTVVFRVDLAVSMRFKNFFWYAPSTMVKDFKAIVEVDGSGRKVDDDKIPFNLPPAVRNHFRNY